MNFTKLVVTFGVTIFFRMKNIYLFLFAFLNLFSAKVFPQLPTVQDCSGAIPICQLMYSESSSYSGEGNFPDEVNSTLSCTDGEINSVWYTFTTATPGFVSFILTPTNTAGSGDDYDWSVYDITNATCAEISSDTAMEVSCNSWGDAVGFNGATGASSANGGVSNTNGPGTNNGIAWNADIPVDAGQTFVIMVSNWSRTANGYTLDFSASTADILGGCTGIKSNQLKDDFYLYPNPASYKITINISLISHLSNLTAEITDIYGKQIILLPIIHDKTEIDVSNLADGIYLFKLNNGDLFSVHKFIKE